MAKLLSVILLALALAMSPSQAFSAAPADCGMDMVGSGNAMDHEKMGCCTPECAITCPPAVLPIDGIEVSATEQLAVPVAIAVVTALHSFSPGADDPPPRHRFA